MTDILYAVSIISNLTSIVLAIFGLYLVYSNYQIWKTMDISQIKARIFLGKGFLGNNWLYVVVAGGLIAIRRIYRLLELTTDTQGAGVAEALFDIIGLFVIFLLVMMAYQWYRLMHVKPLTR